MKKLLFLILVLIFASCTKSTNNNIVHYTVTPFRDADKWSFVFNMDKNLHLSGFVSLDIVAETSIGKIVNIHKNIYLGIVLNNPSTHYSDIDANFNTKILSINSEVILYDKTDYVFIQK